ncbi:protein unc-13 homolog D-like [Macrobrachium nipponense]|uniref:protein unc-13 homolog D-like n=1 Tax=Macrobrachium nipponense TaxID=159736 RepID=UPI0030C8BC51
MQRKTQLVVKMLFTRPGKLLVEVIMARDMVTESDSTSISSRGGGLHHNFHNQPVDSYVKVQLVPQEWFPAAQVRKTKTQRKADPAVYEETFEYDMSKNDDGVRAGLLLFTLKDYNLGRSNTFIGEAVVPLSDLPCVDSSQVHTVPNTYLKMTIPGLDMGYKSLRALQRRTGDKVASSFLKKVSKRLPETRLKTPQKQDDERSRPRSPNLIDRFKFT